MKGRMVCCLPQDNRFGPLGRQSGRRQGLTMTVDEYETIRLIDYMNFTQEECARQMQVARTTVQGIYDQARKKLAQALVEGRPLTITGGVYELYGENLQNGHRRGACRHHRDHCLKEEPVQTEDTL